MQIGLFGKLPAKGDFMSKAVPASVLQPWESWLNRVAPGARHHLGEAWDGVYAAAPVWRFWVGELVWGQAIAGAIVPSIDKVGRQFPLCLILSEGGAAHPAPPVVGQGNERWYAQLDDALLRARSEAFQGDVDALLAGLSLPDGATQPLVEDRRQAFFAYGEEGLAHLLSDVGAHDHQLAAASRSYWWTAGNDRVGPALLAMNDMPDAAGFAAMLVGFGPPAKAVVGETDGTHDDGAPTAAEVPQERPVEEPVAEAIPDHAGWAADPTTEAVRRRVETRPLPTEEPALPPTELNLPTPGIGTPDSKLEDDAPNPFDTHAGWRISSRQKTVTAPDAQPPTEPPAPERDDDTDEILRSIRETMSQAALDTEGEVQKVASADAPIAQRSPDVATEDDEESPFGAVDSPNGLGGERGPGLRGIFALRNRGQEGKD